MSPTVDRKPDAGLLAARALSRLLFGGARYRVEIGAAVAGRAVVSTADLATELGLARQSVNKELQLLEGAGLLVRADGSERRVYLMRQESLYWSWCREALENASEMLERTPRF